MRASARAAGFVALLGSLSLLLPSALGSAAQSAAPAYPPALIVSPIGGHFAFDPRKLVVTVDLVDARRPPSRIRVHVPARFRLFPERTAGSPIGWAHVYVRERPGDTWLTPYEGPVSAEVLDARAEAAAQSCSPGRHSALWLLRVRRGRRVLELPLYLRAAGVEDPPGAGLRLDLCPRRLDVRAVVLSLDHLETPTTRGSYVWRAIVTPTAADRRTPAPGAAYELRSVVSVPHRLTLTGRYLAAKRRGVLRGSLLVGGRPQRGAAVHLTQLHRIVTPHGPRFRDGPIGAAVTARDGTYSFTLPLAATRGFVASTPPTVRSCSGRSFAPAGCRTTTAAGTESDPVTISVP